MKVSKLKFYRWHIFLQTKSASEDIVFIHRVYIFIMSGLFTVFPIYIYEKKYLALLMKKKVSFKYILFSKIVFCTNFWNQIMHILVGSI